MNKRKVLNLFLVLTLFVVGISPAQDRRISVEHWREDLTFLKDKLEEMHPNAWYRLPKERWMESWREIYYQAPVLTDNQMYARIMRLVADLGDGHTRARPFDPSIGYTSMFPIRTYLFTDGLYIVSATRKYAHLVGTKVLRYGSLSAEEAFELAGRNYSWDNEFTRLEKAPYMLMFPRFLKAVGIIDELNRLPLVLESEKGEQIKEEVIDDGSVSPRWRNGSWFNNSFGLSITDAVTGNDATSTPLPLALKDMDNAFWFEYLPEHKTLYFQFNTVRRTNETGEQFAALCDRMFAEADRRKPEKFIIDLRWNSGGNNMLLLPLVNGIIKRDHINRTGTLFAILGRRTFSAAMSCTGRLEYRTNVVFVGEPSGSLPNQYGDAPRVELPHSKLNVSISSVWWMNTHALDRRELIAPQIPVQWSYEDFAQRRDPVMERILTIDEYKTLSQAVREGFESGGIEGLETAYNSYKQVYPDQWTTTESETNRLGYSFMNANQLDAAIAVFELNVETYADYANGWDSLGEAWMNKGDFEKAIRFYEKSFELDPTNTNAERMIARMKQQKNN